MEHVEHTQDKQPKVEMKGMQDGDVNITYADISKAKKMLSYEPKTKFEDGIEQFVAWYHQQRAN